MKKKIIRSRYMKADCLRTSAADYRARANKKNIDPNEKLSLINRAFDMEDEARRHEQAATFAGKTYIELK